jgi:uncharacterized repeat protein (TIGR03803 family)
MISNLSKFLLAGACALPVFVPSAEANTFKTVHSFRGGRNGDSPYSALTLDGQGNLYGTTKVGGAKSCNDGQGCGTVFRITPDGTTTIVYTFKGGSDGAYPTAAVVLGLDGAVYGTTSSGGANDVCEGCGTVFRVSADGQETVLHTFSGEEHGATPTGSLAFDDNGNLYGTTEYGGTLGSRGYGTVFKLTPDGKETTLHAFQNDGHDGVYPIANIVRDKSRNIYGTTYIGGKDDRGTVFKLAPDGTETILHWFGSGFDGTFACSDLTIDKKGNVYGTTAGGGGASAGTVFKVAPDGTETVLHSFESFVDGQSPIGGVVLDGNGNLYGTTGGDRLSNFGSAYRLSADGTVTVLHTFGNGKDGNYPVATLAGDGFGNFYGTTVIGGYVKKSCDPYGCGTVFRLTP